MTLVAPSTSTYEVGASPGAVALRPVWGRHPPRVVRVPGAGVPEGPQLRGLATLGWVHWHNNQRLHGYLGDVPPSEFEGKFYATHQGHEALVADP